ncbi:hypothetical protein CSOJ01_15755 [Colletotrichum sojae]|uniref:Uncharacterized protein n=1 Tax=Colletotrichum sojae TaxID=2175907 RepID=A0A8H6MHC1_9PEZI|nr:hypothetical protein CSOJ01_15755 [Colletotrichum sojae]
MSKALTRHPSPRKWRHTDLYSQEIRIAHLAALGAIPYARRGGRVPGSAAQSVAHSWMVWRVGVVQARVWVTDDVIAMVRRPSTGSSDGPNATSDGIWGAAAGVGVDGKMDGQGWEELRGVGVAVLGPPRMIDRRLPVPTA